MTTVMPTLIEIDESTRDLLAWNVANEVINGFKVIDFEKTIGVPEQEFRLIALALRDLPKGTKAGLDLEKARFFRNALAVVLDELEVEEFSIRTGHGFNEGHAVLQKLDSFISKRQGATN